MALQEKRGDQSPNAERERQSAVSRGAFRWLSLQDRPFDGLLLALLHLGRDLLVVRGQAVAEAGLEVRARGRGVHLPP